MKILKHQFPTDVDSGNICEVDLPIASKILTTQIQHGLVTMWYTVPNYDGLTGLFTHRFGFYMTGFDGVPINARYMNTFQFLEGAFVLHLFEI